MNWPALLAGIGAGAVVGWPLSWLTTKADFRWERRKVMRRMKGGPRTYFAATVGVDGTLSDPRWVKDGKRVDESTGPARDETGLELLRTDPDEFFRQTRRQLP